MAKRYEIELKFSSPGAKQLRQALDALAAAQGRLAKKQSSLNTQGKMAQKNTVKLIQSQEKHRLALLKSQKQIGKLNLQLQKMRMQNKALAEKLKKSTVATNRFRIATAGLQRTVGAIRNQILLFTFAFGGLIASFRGAVQTSMQFEAVKVRLNSMFGSVERGTKAFNTFNKVAATTPFTLSDVVEAGAALTAFGTNAEKMIKPTADLAAFMGVSATEAAQALGRAFAGGAGAADILRERGILQLIRDFKGIDDLSKVSLPDFRKALEETLLDPSAGIAGATDRLAQTMTGLVSNMSDAFTRMSAALGDLINMRGVVSTLTNAFSGLAKMFTEMGETTLETSIRELGELGDAAVELRLEMLNLRMQSLELDATERKTTLDSNKIREAIVASDSMRLDMTKDLANLQLDILKNHGGEEKILERISAINGSLSIGSQKRSDLQTKQLEDEKKELEALLTNVNLLSKLVSDEKARKAALEENLNLATLYEQIQRQILGLSASITEETKNLAKELKLTEEQTKTVLEGEKLRLETREQLFSDHFNKVLGIAQKSIDQQKQAELSALRDTDKFRRASAEERQDMEKDALKNLQNQQNTIFKINQANEIIKVILSSMATASKLKDMAEELKGVATAAFAVGNKVGGTRAAAGAAALRVQRGLVIASGAAQAGLLAGQQPPQFARGGSFITDGQQSITVGDNPGGRERVDITPLSTPDFGDAGGGSSINVNIMGNVIGTQEFVRDNLLPEIENTIKRNLA
tara:strand:- start:4832 stop:7090 length:2259 start_codon:yes stop_codon:yes gene_type:complete